MPAKSSPHLRASLVAQSRSESFVELIKIAQLDPHRDLRFSNWSGIRFEGMDLRDFDFTGSRLVECDFRGARIRGARFEAADIKGTRLDKADDWETYVSRWIPAERLVSMRHLRVGAEFQDSPLGPRMVIVSQGEFQMGSPDDAAFSDEYPQHSVTIANHFAVSVSPITLSEFEAFVTATTYQVSHAGGRPWRNPGFRQTGDHPVVRVSWSDAQAYVAWLKESSGGRPYRLLSESEWEYCCRAGTTTAYNTGDAILPSQANFGEGVKGTTSVFKFPCNAWGLHDMHGNVWEWCADAWHEDYRDNPPSDGSVWRGGKAATHILRGGSWGSGSPFLRSVGRLWHYADDRDTDIGFRVARSL